MVLGADDHRPCPYQPNNNTSDTNNVVTMESIVTMFCSDKVSDFHVNATITNFK